ncbi:MAG: phosphate ABC transporter, permease protein PstA, partial [Coprococcus sp.]
MYSMSREGLHMDQAYATAVVLLVLVIGINWLSGFIAKKITKGNGNGEN